MLLSKGFASMQRHSLFNELWLICTQRTLCAAYIHLTGCALWLVTQSSYCTFLICQRYGRDHTLVISCCAVTAQRLTVVNRIYLEWCKFLLGTRLDNLWTNFLVVTYGDSSTKSIPTSVPLGLFSQSLPIDCDSLITINPRLTAIPSLSFPHAS